MPVSRIEAMLKLFFLSRSNSNMNILKLDDSNFTAFVLNNWKKLRDEFKRIDVLQSIQGKLDIFNIQKNDFTIPLTERYKFNPRKNNTKYMKSNAYDKYSNSITLSRPSDSEILMEQWIENNKNLFDFVYKNGDKGYNYFSLVYATNGGVSHFYPDFIIRTRNKDLWIIETKGGENKEGEDKNIDPYAPAKYESLKRYANDHNLHWVFVRDKDGDLLYLNDGDWVEDMENTWKSIEKLF